MMSDDAIKPRVPRQENSAGRGSARLLAEWLGFTILAIILLVAIYLMIVRPLWRPKSAVRFDYVDDVVVLESGGVAVTLGTSRQLQVFDARGQRLLVERLDEVSPPYRIESEIANDELRLSVYTQKHSQVGPSRFSVPNQRGNKASTVVVRGLPFFQTIEIRNDKNERAFVQFGLIALINSHPIGTAAFFFVALIAGTTLGYTEFRRERLRPDHK